MQQTKSLLSQLSTLASTQIGKRQQQAVTNRANFPDTARIVDSLAAVFGPVKVLHAIENGKEIGKPQPFDGIDANKIIAADDWHKAAQKRGVRK
jgi:hypothetical protein